MALDGVLFKASCSVFKVCIDPQALNDGVCVCKREMCIDSQALNDGVCV